MLNYTLEVAVNSATSGSSKALSPIEEREWTT